MVPLSGLRFGKELFIRETDEESYMAILLKMVDQKSFVRLFVSCVPKEGEESERLKASLTYSIVPRNPNLNLKSRSLNFRSQKMSKIKKICLINLKTAQSLSMKTSRLQRI
jgi:hypothetical protein